MEKAVKKGEKSDDGFALAVGPMGILRAEPFLHRTRKLPCIFTALFVCYSSRSRLRDSLLRPC